MSRPTLPGDLPTRKRVERMIRVDHAGEFGAERIYSGQIAVLGRGDKGDILRHMKAQEEHHLATFAGLVADRRVRPTALLPLWHIAGWALGAATAAMGTRAAMACTVAVEEAIDEHYQDQYDTMPEGEEELRATIEQFRLEELEHRDIGLENEAELAPAYRLLSAVIKAGCKVAIAVSERVEPHPDVNVGIPDSVPGASQMEEDDLRASTNIEDRRGGGGSGGFGGVQMGGLGLGAVVVLSLLGYVFGFDPSALINGAEQASAPQQQQQQQASNTPAPRGTPDDQMGQFVARVLGETEDVWSQVLPQEAQKQYQKPTLVLYSGMTSSGCGTAQSAMGPFYCPVDRKVYLDTAFFHDMQQKLGGGGDFAYAYVISHEIGHHVQNLLGLLPKVQDAEQNAPDQAAANNLSVRTELMADCLAGVWAFHMNQRHHNIEQSDVQQAVATATAIGDDRLRQASGRASVPDSFTHGSSEQRSGG